MDIDHLKEIGKADTFPISVDSSLRNKQVYPTPAEYEVVFDEPFKNVVGFDVLDATIPNTMYTVDAHNDLLSFVVRLYSSFERANPENYPFESGQRTLNEYFSDLAQAREFLAVWDSTKYDTFRLKIIGSLLPISTVSAAVVQDPVDAPTLTEETTPGVLMDRDILVSPVTPAFVESLGIEPLPIDTETSYFITYDLGQDKYFVQNNNARVIETVELPTFELSPGDRRVLVSAIESIPVVGGTVVRYGTVPVAQIEEAPISSGSSMTLPKFDNNQLVGAVSYGIFRVDKDFYNDTVVTYHHELEFHNLSIDNGDHDAESLIEAIEAVMPKYNPAGTLPDTLLDIINLSATSTVNPGNYNRQRKINFSSIFRFWFDMGKSTITDLIGFSSLAFENQSSYSPYRIGNNLRVFEAAIVGTAYSLTTPGIITLLGERLIVLRCPQIEEHAYPSYSHSSNGAGLGIFKLYDTTIAHLRFDFTKLSRLDFHPIGKLSKIKLRFERIDGKLYDFKGVDHHLFLNIKFLNPRNERSLPPAHSRLNPDYDPNTLRYQINQQRELDESDTESDEELLRDEQHAARFRDNRRDFILSEEMARGARPKFASETETETERESETDSETDSESESESEDETNSGYDRIP
nr:hypothetical protein TetV2_00101 [Oceanusvirus sp.]